MIYKRSYERTMRLDKKKITIAIGIIVILALLISIPIGNSDSKKTQEKHSETTEEHKDQGEVLEKLADDSGTRNNIKTDKNSDTKTEENNKISDEKNENSSQTTTQVPVVDNTNNDENSSDNNKTDTKKPEKKYPKIAGGKLTCDSFGRYSGQYVEDGRDELVESVATILVTNKSDEYLEYATLTFDVNGNAANFIVTGLPAGSSAWVMDANKLVIESGAAFTYQDCLSEFRDDVNSKSNEVGLASDGNMLTATNKTDKTLEDVVVYYRVMHTDGNYLGGVTYTAKFDTLEPGESTEVIAGHYSAENSEVVRVSWNNQ